MENSFEIKCVNGHVAMEVCTEKSCQYPSGICRQESCEYSSKHEECLNSSKASNLVKTLQKRAKESQKQLDELVISSIDKMMKRLEMIKMEYESVFNSQSKYLWGNKKKLYELLESGQAERLQPKFVGTVVDEMGKGKDSKQELERQKQLERLGESVERAHKEQESCIAEIRKLWKGEEKQTKQIKQVKQVKYDKTNNSTKFLFTPQLTNQYVDISRQGRSVKQTTGYNSYSLLTPSISQSNNSKVRIKVLNDQGVSHIGVADSELLTKNGFGYRQEYQEMYLIQGSGYSFSYSNPEQHKKFSSFRYGSGDVLEMEYLEGVEELKISNLTKDMSYTLTDVSNKNNSLHYCVYTFRKDEELEIVE